MYNAFVAQSVERVTVNHEVDRSKLSGGVILVINIEMFYMSIFMYVIYFVIILFILFYLWYCLGFWNKQPMSHVYNIYKYA